MATHTVASASQGDKLSFFAEIQIIFGTVQEPRRWVFRNPIKIRTCFTTIDK